MEGFLKWMTGGPTFIATSAYALDNAPEMVNFLENTLFAGIEDDGIANFAADITTLFADLAFIGIVTALVVGGTGKAANSVGIY